MDVTGSHSWPARIKEGVFGMRRREFMALFGAAAVWPLAADAQQSTKIQRIGYLDYGAGILPSGGFAPFHDTYRRKPFLEGLRERGWVEGQNVTIERRLRRARQIGSLHLPLNSLPSTST